MYHRLDNQMEEEVVVEEEEEEEVKKDNKRGFIYPLCVTNQELSRHVNLLVTEEDGSWHYSTIKNFSGFLRAQYSKRTGSNTFYCYSCLHGFQAKKGEKVRTDCKLLAEHAKYCKQQKSQRVSYPQKKVTEFTNIQKTLKQPFVGYADFECILKKESDIDAMPGIAETSKKETKYQTHTAASYFTKFTSIDPDFTLSEDDCFQFPQRKTHVGDDVAEHFLDYVQTVAEKIYKKYIEKPKDMIYTSADEIVFDNSTSCHICKENFRRPIDHCHNKDETKCALCIEESDIIVRDHCHITGVSIVVNAFYYFSVIHSYIYI